MRIRILQKPALQSIDGIRLDHFLPGILYEVGHTLGSYLMAEGWAEPVATEDPAMLIPMTEFEADLSPNPPNLVREIYPPYYDAPPSLAADRRRQRRTRKSRETF